MILLEEYMPMNVSKDFWDMFLVVIQLGGDYGGSLVVLEQDFSF